MYSELATEAAQNSWKTKILPVKVRCRGLVATSTTSLSKRMGLRGHSLQEAIRSMANAAGKKQRLALD